MILYLLLMLSVTGWAEEQVRTFNDGYDDYGCYYYQPIWRWESIRNANFDRGENPDSLLQLLRKQEQPYVICPWWYEDLYSKLPKDSVNMIGRIGYVGYVLNPSSGAQLLANEWNSSNCVLDDTAYLHIPFDLVVYCRSGEDLDIFLGSKLAQRKFAEMVFDPQHGAINRLHHGERPKGVHFYLPEVTFLKKKELMRFVKSVSMVIDAYEQDGVRLYEGEKCIYTITFSPEAKGEMNYISGLLEFVDAVYFASYNEYGLLEGKAEELTRLTDPTSLLTRIANQFYLIHWGMSGDQVLEKGSSDFRELMTADYADFDWLLYFYIDVVLVVILLVLAALYNLSSRFYMFIEGYRDYVVPVLITLVTEILIVLLFMIESFSQYTLLVNMYDNGRYFLLALPLVFILINIFLKNLNQNEKVP